MKRFHVHLSVPDLAASIRFYSGMFGMPPTVEKTDYAKWMLDEPRVNFAISHRGAREGLNHLGLQADSADELADIRGRFEAAERGAVTDEPDAQCCYAVSDKHWVRDPQGIAWEAFHTLDSVPMFGGNEERDERNACGTTATPCCGPEAAMNASASRKACCS